MKNFYKKLFCILLICVFTPLFAHAYQFTKDLKIGVTDSDVVQLQNILNIDSVTAVSTFGPGSKGYETSYFGGLTKQAVVRFQEKYANDILIPAGLSSGTGFVGPSTRKKLNKIQQTVVADVVKQNISAPSNTNTNTNVGGVVAGVVSPDFLFGRISNSYLLIKSISAFEVKPGDNLTIVAGGLLQDNTLHIGLSYSQKISSVNGNFTISVPNIPNGDYQVWIENKNGSSKDKSPQYIKVSNQSKTSPVISRSYPQTASKNSQITLEGNGFDSQNNTIYSTLGAITGVSSNSGKITFSIADFPEIKRNGDSDLGNNGVITYSVKSSNGYTKNFGVFTLGSSVAKSANIYKTILSFVDRTIDSVYGTKKAFAFVDRMEDGGTIGGVDTECTCSGSEIVKYSSYIDNQDYKYIYSLLTTQTYANSDPTTNGQYFLSTLLPYGVCMVIKGEECDSEGSPDGTLMTIGSS